MLRRIFIGTSSRQRRLFRSSPRELGLILSSSHNARANTAGESVGKETNKVLYRNGFTYSATKPSSMSRWCSDKGYSLHDARACVRASPSPLMQVRRRHVSITSHAQVLQPWRPCLTGERTLSNHGCSIVLDWERGPHPLSDLQFLCSGACLPLHGLRCLSVSLPAYMSVSVRGIASVFVFRMCASLHRHLHPLILHERKKTVCGR